MKALRIVEYEIRDGNYIIMNISEVDKSAIFNKDGRCSALFSGLLKDALDRPNMIFLERVEE